MSFVRYILQSCLMGRGCKADYIQFPLYSSRSELDTPMDEVQQAAATRLIGKLDSGEYGRRKNDCICGNCQNEMDELVTRFDMHGIPLDVLLCGRCGLMRSAMIFDAPSNESYYRYEYRDIHGAGSRSIDRYFAGQLERGSGFLNLITSSGILKDISTVMEIGCGCGGVLFPFHQEGKKVFGFDYDENYIHYGMKKGMELACLGEGNASYRGTSPDLLILSHVVEHFLDPKGELLDLVEIVPEGKFLLIEVPGLFSERAKKVLYGYPVRYFQVAHVVQYFYYDFLKLFYAALNLEVIRGDETATFILRKPVNWSRPDPRDIFAPELAKYPDMVRKYLKETCFDCRFRPDLHKLARGVVRGMEFLGVKDAAKRLLRRWKLM